MKARIEEQKNSLEGRLKKLEKEKKKEEDRN